LGAGLMPLAYETVVVCVRADPEPDAGSIRLDSQGAIT
jgi:hypothetical protein